MLLTRRVKDQNRLLCNHQQEILTKTPVYKLVTSVSNEITDSTLYSKVDSVVAEPLLLVGKSKPRGTKPCRQQRRRQAQRERDFKKAVSFAYKMDFPLTTFLTLTWDALLRTGEHNDGCCLGKSEADRDYYTRRELNRLCRSKGIPFAALWGRDIGNRLGLHSHTALFWPSRYLKDLVSLIERITGSSAGFVLGPYEADVVARSVCGGWQIDMNRRRDSEAGAQDLAAYIAGQHNKHPTISKMQGKPFGISEAIGKTAQRQFGA